MLNLYFAIKEEIAITKAKKLNKLFEIQEVREMKYFRHSSARVRNEMILATDEEVFKTCLDEIRDRESMWLFD